MSIDKTVVSCVLGDGHVSKRGSISFHHSIAQKDYLIHKLDILSRYGFKFRVYEKASMSYGQMRNFIRADGYVSTKSKLLRGTIYPNGVKEVPPWAAHQFDFSDWALLYMDDGRQNVIRHTNNLINGERVRIECPPFVNRYEIDTQALDYRSLTLLINSLANLGVEASLDGKGRICVRKAASKAAFFLGVEAFIHPTMRYKVSALPSLSFTYGERLSERALL